MVYAMYRAPVRIVSRRAYLDIDFPEAGFGDMVRRPNGKLTHMICHGNTP